MHFNFMMSFVQNKLKIFESDQKSSCLTKIQSHNKI